jgi:hypothetical protein
MSDQEEGVTIVFIEILLYPVEVWLISG